MLNRLLSGATLALALLVSGCGGSDEVGASAGTPAFVAATSSSVVGTAGGSVGLTAADGTRYTLAVPAGALPKDTALSLTTAAPGEGQRFRVVAGPDGLVFRSGLAATLTIALPAGRELPTSGGLTYSGAPVPSTRNPDGSIVLQLSQLRGTTTVALGVASIARALERLRPTAAAPGSALVCRSPNVSGGPEAGAASYDALDVSRYIDCVTGQIEDLTAVDNFDGAIALALSLDEIFQRASLGGSSFMDTAKTLVCTGRQRSLDTLTSITVNDLDDLLVIERVAHWDMFAQKLGHECAGQPTLSAAVQPKIDDALTLMDIDPDHISSADVSSTGYLDFKNAADRSIQLRHKLVAMARSLGRPITTTAAGGAREQAQAVGTYSAEALASAQLQARLEPATLKNLLASPWTRCRSASDFVPLMSLVDLYGALDALKSAAQYCGTQLTVEVLDNRNVSTQTLAGLGGVAAGQSQASGSVNVTTDGVVKLTGPIQALRCPASVASSEELVVRFKGVEVARLSAAPYLSSALQFNVSDLRAAASLATSNTDPQQLTIERAGAACSAYWGAAPAPLVNVTLTFRGKEQIAFYRYQNEPGQINGPAVGIVVMNTDGSGQRVIPGTIATAEMSWGPDRRRLLTSDPDGCVLVVDTQGIGSLERSLCPLGVYAKRPEFSRDGQKIAFIGIVGGNEAVYVMDSDGSNVISLTTPIRGTINVAHWSPDGRRIVFDAVNELGTYFAVRAVDVDGTHLVSLTTPSSGTLDQYPSWSADGTKVYFTRMTSANRQLMQVHADGTGLSEVLRLGLGYLFDNFSLSADESKVIFSGTLLTPPYNQTIMSIKLDGTGLTDLSRGNGDLIPVWSK